MTTMPIGRVIISNQKVTRGGTGQSSQSHSETRTQTHSTHTQQPASSIQSQACMAQCLGAGKLYILNGLPLCLILCMAHTKMSHICELNHMHTHIYLHMLTIIEARTSVSCARIAIASIDDTLYHMY